MFQEVPPCTDTVSPLWAMIFGAGDACVEIGLWSLMPVLVLFVVGIMALQWIANRFLFGRKTAEPTRRGDPRGVRLKTGQVMSRHVRRNG